MPSTSSADQSRRGTGLIGILYDCYPDPVYAQAFLDAAPETTPAVARDGGGDLADLGASLSRHVVIRTRFFDDYLIDAAAAGVGQVVLLAAGLDTRAFRLPWPDDVRIFELDLTEVLTFKAQVLARSDAAQRCGHAMLPVDLRTNWRGALAAAGQDLRQPTAWLVEGLLIYLTAAETKRRWPTSPPRPHQGAVLPSNMVPLPVVCLPTALVSFLPCAG